MEIVLFDGVCNLCNGAVNFIIDHDPNRRFQFASLQSDTGRALLVKHRLTVDFIDSIVLISNEKAYVKSGAVLEIARNLKAPWSWLSVFTVLPRFLRDAAYDLIARHRYRLFGRSDACRIPTPELKARFLE